MLQGNTGLMVTSFCGQSCLSVCHCLSIKMLFPVQLPSASYPMKLFLNLLLISISMLLLPGRPLSYFVFHCLVNFYLPATLPVCGWFLLHAPTKHLFFTCGILWESYAVVILWYYVVLHFQRHLKSQACWFKFVLLILILFCFSSKHCHFHMVYIYNRKYRTILNSEKQCTISWVAF